jgi:predicted Zn finger-like uncharacterized protein
MRLICPNCDAQYEVDDRAIPETGRDVQCSGCGHAWFQLPPELEDDLAAEDELYSRVNAPTGKGFQPDAPVRRATDAPSDPDADRPAAPIPPALQRRGLDESLLAVLREEAEREAEVRRAEARPLESQPDLGLGEPAASQGPAAEAARRRVAQLKGLDPDFDPDAPPEKAARRDLLPDIEEINSTLRASGDRRGNLGEADIKAPSQEARRSGFRIGFTLMMTLAMVTALAYVMAPKIVAQIPTAAPAMAQFVTTVDKARVALDDGMKWAVSQLGAGG